jgi:hypothetical protein
MFSNRLFEQSQVHEDQSSKPILPGVHDIGMGYHLPAGPTDARYFEVK